MDNSGGSDLCEIGTYQVCDHITTTNTFTTKACVEVFKIQSGSLNCNSQKALYLLRCKVCDDTPYIRKAKTNFCLRFNNYKSEHRFCVLIISQMRSLYCFVVVWLSWSYLKFKWSLWFLKFKWLQQDSNPNHLVCKWTLNLLAKWPVDVVISGKWTFLGQSKEYFSKKIFILIKIFYILEFFVFQGLIHKLKIQNFL